MQPIHNTLKSRAARMAKQWNLTLQDPLRIGSARAIFKVSTVDGPAVLKIYTQIGAGGEGAAVPYLRALPPGIGVQIHKTTPLRRAVLMEWLDGPSLDQVLDGGDESLAETSFADIAAKLSPVTFRFKFLFGRAHSKKMQRRFHTAAADASGIRKDLFTHAAQMLDQLIATTTDETLIHGDLQFRNVMLTPHGPRVIDPKGFRADPASEYRLATVPRYQTCDLEGFSATIKRRAALFSEASQLDQSRIVQWAAVTFAGRIMRGSLRKADPATIDPYLKVLLDLAEA